jgi:hypothetical protein
MSHKLRQLICAFFVAGAVQLAAFSQTPNDAASKSGEWIRVRSDDGEFSVEVPAAYGFFADKDGFSLTESNNTYQLREMHLYNAYHDRTLISFESYRAPKAALDALREKENRDRGRTSEIKAAGYRLKEVVLETAESYTVRRYLSSKDHIYVLTAASRGGETPAMKRFFESLAFAPGAQVPETTPAAVAFAALKGTPVGIEASPAKSPTADKTPTPTADKTPAATPDASADLKKLVIVVKPLASYTDAARRRLAQGVISLRITFAGKGYVSRVELIRTLPEGLLRQAVFAALRIRFLPQEVNNEPVTVSKLVEYSFNVY